MSHEKGFRQGEAPPWQLLATQRHWFWEVPLPSTPSTTQSRQWIPRRRQNTSSRFLHGTIKAASHDLFESANSDPLVYPLQTWLHALAPGPTSHSLQVKGAVMSVLFPFHSQELMALLCCYIEGVYVRTAKSIGGIGCPGGFNHWYRPGFWIQQEAASSLLLHQNKCTVLRAEGNAFRVGHEAWAACVGVLLS